MKFSFVLVSFLGCLAVCHADAVRLQVVGPDGKPVAGARVHVVETSGNWRNHKTEPPLDLQSDAAGRVVFESKNALSDPKDKTQDTAKAAQSRGFMLAQVKAAGLTLEQVALKAGDNTLTLHPGKTLSGVLLGEDEKPVAGVRIRLRSIGHKAEDEQKRIYFSDTGAPQTQSDAAGKWSFEGLPLEGTAIVSVADPRFQSESFSFDVAQDAPPLFLERGATIKGRLLKPDGTPAGGVKFYAGDFENQPVTRADGTFEVAGLGDTRLYLQVLAFGSDKDKPPFLVPAKDVEGLKLGETRDLGDWKAEAGTHVKGRVEEEGTKKPIPGASVQLWGRGNGGDGQSDKDGAFDFLAASNAVGLSVSANGFVSQQKQDVPDPKNGVIDLGTIALKPGQKIAGIVKNEGGAPQSITLYAEGKGDRVYARSNEGDGNFSFDGLQEGSYTIKSDEFKVVSGDKFSIGATAKATATLSVVVEGRDKAQGATRVEGRVLDEQDQPVAGAKIKLQIRSGNSYSSATAISNTNGTYSAPISMQNATPKVTGVSRPGFILGTSALKNADGVWRGDILLQKRGSALKGRVVDAQGRAVAHAFVGLSTGFGLPVATDDTGAFELKDAPLRGVTLLASDGPRLASLALKKGDVLITLPDAAPIEDRAALADEVLSRSRLGYDWESKWDVLGEARIEAAFIRAGKDSWSWRGFMQTLAEREPATLLARQAQLREQTPPGERAGFDRVVMLARAGSTDETERVKVKDWLAAQEAEKREVSAATVTQLLRLAQVAAKLDPKAGALWLDYASQIAAQLPGNGGNDTGEWGGLAADISPDAPGTLIEDWSPSAALQLLGTAMTVYAKRGDAASARKTFALMEQLAQKAAQTPGKDVVEGYHQKPKDWLNQGREQLARALALSDPGAALEVATPLEDYRRAQVLLVVAKNAVKLQQPDVARRALNAVFEVNTGNVEFVAQAAGVAQTFDAALADDLFARAFDKALPKDEGYGGWTPSLAAWAQERAAKWPGQSRILIEREWLTRVETAQKPTNDYDSNGPAMQNLVGAMARVAPRRALEMAEQVTEKRDLRLEARGDIAVALLTKQ